MELNEMQPEDSILEVAKKLNNIDRLLEDINVVLQSKEKKESIGSTIEATKTSKPVEPVSQKSTAPSEAAANVRDAKAPATQQDLAKTLPIQEEAAATLEDNLLQQQENQFNKMMTNMQGTTPQAFTAPIKTPESTDASKPVVSNIPAPDNSKNINLPVVEDVPPTPVTLNINTISKAEPNNVKPVNMSLPAPAPFEPDLSGLLNHPMNKAFGGPTPETPESTPTNLTEQPINRVIEQPIEKIESSAKAIKDKITLPTAPVEPVVTARESKPAMPKITVPASAAPSPAVTSKAANTPVTPNMPVSNISKQSELPAKNLQSKTMPEIPATTSAMPVRENNSPFTAAEEPIKPSVKVTQQQMPMTVMEDTGKPTPGVESKDKSMVNIEKNMVSLTSNLTKNMAQLTSQLTNLNNVATQILSYLPNINTGKTNGTYTPMNNRRESNVVMGGSINEFREGLTDYFSSPRSDSKFTLT